jgi:AcrR family transcriptional regulator
MLGGARGDARPVNSERRSGDRDERSGMNVPMDEIASRIAQRALAKRGAGYAAEVRQLLDAALEVMRTRGPSASPRVADIVARAGLSNEAFYRHFPSKGALVAALLEDGTQRLQSYLAHRMEKEESAQGKVRSWIEGVLKQTSEEVAGTTRAVLWNAGGVGADGATGATSVAR